jgi:hypothetical protein
MPRVGFKPTMPVFEQVKTVHALDCAATMISTRMKYSSGIYCPINSIKNVFFKSPFFLKIKGMLHIVSQM